MPRFIEKKKMGSRNRRFGFNRRPSVRLRFLLQRLPPRHRRTFRAPRDPLPLQRDPRHSPQGQGAEPGQQCKVLVRTKNNKYNWKGFKIV